MTKKKYVYMMQLPDLVTIEKVSALHKRIVSHRFWLNRYRRGKHWYYGWVAFDEPLDDWDAMESGLVPIFDCYNPPGACK